MKSWRTLIIGALLVASPAFVVGAGAADDTFDLALASPRLPAAAASPDSPSSPTSDLAKPCDPSLEKIETFPLVLCVERERTSSGENLEANLFPYSSNVTTFGNPGYRVQYLYTSDALVKLAKTACTIESMHSRAVSFSASRTTNYQNASAEQFIRVNASDGTFTSTFNSNVNGPSHLDYSGIKRVTQIAGTDIGGKNQNPATLSDWLDRGPDPASRNDLDTEVNLEISDPSMTNLLVDFLMRLSSTQNAGAAAVWDVTTDAMGGGCPRDVKRAFGSHRLVNPNNLTTALSLDNKGFVWVFRGLALPPPATIQQQIAEIIRLLVTPEGLRCTGLDLDPNESVEDHPIRFPEGADWDPISPRVTSGSPITGDEARDGAREAGYFH